MKHYNEPRLRQMTEHLGFFGIYKPFPGKNPVRLSIRITGLMETPNGRGKLWTYWSYNGRWNYHVLRKAQQIHDAIVRKTARTGIIVTPYVREYCQSCALYTGNFQMGSYSFLHGQAFLVSPSRITHARTGAAYTIQPQEIVTVGGRSMFVPKDWWQNNKAQTLRAVIKALRSRE